MTNGTVKFFNAAKGFGFITPEGEGKDIFVMAAAVTQSGMSGLKPGQRLSFETVPDTKGPKAVNLKLLADAPVVKPPAPRVEAVAAQPSYHVTAYIDPSQDESDLVLDALAACGQEARVVDYIATPPSREQLKELSVLLRGSDQSLVRKYDPLFRELSLDDRFIGDSEFWTAIFEHPTLINGPVLAMGSRARTCRSDDDVRAFFGLTVAAPAAKPKTISSRLAALVNGHSVTDSRKPEAASLVKENSAPVQARQEAPALNPVPAAAVRAPLVQLKVRPRPVVEAKPEAKPVANPAPQAIKAPVKAPIKAVAKPAPKPVSKPAKASAAKKPAPKAKTKR